MAAAVSFKLDSLLKTWGSKKKKKKKKPNKHQQQRAREMGVVSTCQ
jgi:hypothetical protein